MNLPCESGACKDLRPPLWAGVIRWIEDASCSAPQIEDANELTRRVRALEGPLKERAGTFTSTIGELRLEGQPT